jgi:2-methylcitrate dehydratase PrpD
MTLQAQIAGLEGRLVDYLTDTGYNDLPASAVEYCKLLVLDSLGVALAGHNAPGCAAVAALVGSWGTVSGGSTVLLHGFKTSPPLAALANSTLMHALDFDDTLDSSALHTFVSVLPAALATAEAEGAVDGKKFIAALVLGTDIIGRISFAIQRPLSWIRSSTCGSFGAATAAAKILGLDRDGIANSLGIVYSQTSGNAQGLVEGKLVKRMQPGFASRAGVTAAFLARAGITGSREFLTGKYGYYNLYEAGEYEAEPVTAGLGTHQTIMDLSIKPYPSCRMTHASIDAALQLRAKISGHTDDIEVVQVMASKMVTEMVGKPFVLGSDPQVDAQFSIPYSVSAALLRGDVFLPDFTTAAITEKQVMRLAGRVQVTEEPRMPAKDLMYSHMRIVMKDGRTHEVTVKVPLGNPANPISAERCRGKFLKCVAASGVEFGECALRELLDMIAHLEDVKDVSRLVTLMCADQPAKARSQAAE